MTTAELLDEYLRVLKQKGPDSDAAYDLLMSHVEEAEFIHLADEAREKYLVHQKAIRLLVMLAPLYICLTAAFLLMIWFG